MGLKAFLSGGFLAGKRTYILGALAALSALASWAVGDASAVEMLKAVAEVALGMGLITLRIGIAAAAQPGPTSELPSLEPIPVQTNPAPPVNPDIGQIVAWSAFDKMKEQFGAWTSDAECEALAKRIARGVEIRLGLAPTHGLRIQPYPDNDEKAIIELFHAFDHVQGTRGSLALNIRLKQGGEWLVDATSNDRYLVAVSALDRTSAFSEVTQELRNLIGTPT